MMFGRPLLLAAALLLLAPPQAVWAADEAEGEESDETKALLKQLTISMVKEVIDEKTFIVRDSKKSGNTILRLGNVDAPWKEKDMGPATYAEKLKKSKDALEKVLGKQMIWWKAAKDEHQTATHEGEAIVVADVWQIDGKHINSLLKKEKHVSHLEQYKEELARDILTAQAEEEKKESYKELEGALKDSEKEQKKQRAKAVEAQKAAEKEEELKGEPIGFGGWVGVITLLFIAVGAATNFGQPRNKKLNLNRKKGFFEKLFAKVKGS